MSKARRAIDKKDKRKKKKGTGKKVFLFILLVLLVVGGIVGYRIHENGGGLKGFLATAVGHDANTLKNLPKIYCVLLGQSENLTDTIMIAEYDPQEQQASILSIPRDTYIGNNRMNVTAWDKINAVYQTGTENVLKEINELTGLDIKYYLKVDTQAFKKLVDAIGGVEFDVPIDMKYDDNRQNLHIDLKAGKQKLDGDKAEQVVRFRHNNDGTTYPYEYGMEDLGRMKTQRNFLTALAKQTLKVENIFKINEFIDIANEYVETNLDFNTIKDYVPYIVEFDMANLKTGQVPGKSEQGPPNGVWVYFADDAKLKEMIDDLFINPNKLDEEDKKSNSTVDTSSIDKTKLKIEVLNGTSSNTKLEKVVAKLENAGYTVEKTGNTTDTSTTTVIIRKDVPELVQEDIKQILETQTVTTGGEATVNITIIIGRDYEG